MLSASAGWEEGGLYFVFYLFLSTTRIKDGVIQKRDGSTFINYVCAGTTQR